MKIFFSILLLFITYQLSAQSITNAPIYLGQGDSIKHVAIINGTLRTMYGVDLAKARLDSFINALAGVKTTVTTNTANITTNTANIALKWGITGNAGISPSSNFLGTTDNISLRFRTNNKQHATLDSNGVFWAGHSMMIGLPSTSTFDPANHRSTQYAADGSYPAKLQIVNSDSVNCVNCTVGGNNITSDSTHSAGVEISSFNENSGQAFIHFKKARGNWKNPRGILAGDILGGQAGWGYLGNQANFSGSVVGFHWVAAEDFTSTHLGTEQQFFVQQSGVGGVRKYTMYMLNDGTIKLPSLAGTGARVVTADANGILSATSGSSTALTNTYVGYGNGSNLLTGTSDMTFDATNNILGVNAETSTNPVIRIQDADVTPSNISAAGFIPGLGTNEIGSMRGASASTGGIQLLGVTSNNTSSFGMILTGISGTTAPTNAATVIRSGKWNGSTNITTLANSEIVAEFRNWTNTIFQMKGDGSFAVNSSGATPAASALMDLTSTTKGVLLPRMTTSQRDAISSPAEGLLIYNLTTHQLNYYNATSWVAF